MSTRELVDFLSRIWQDTNGVVRLATRDSNRVFRNQLYSWPDDGAALVEYIVANVAQKNEVYYSPDLYKPEALADRKATKDYVLGSHVLCVDFDGNAPQEDSWYEENDLPLPTIRVQSSTPDRQHAYWVLDEFIEDIDQLELMRKTITYRTQADNSGWDAGQLLRPPYTTNFGYAHDRKDYYDVVIEETSSRVYPVTSFPTPRDFRPLVERSIDESSLPSIIKILAEGNFVAGFADAFDQSANDVREGKRSSTLVSIGYYGAESGLTDTEIYALVQNADERWGKYKHRTDRHKRLVDIVERARAKYPHGGISIGLKDTEAEIAPRIQFGYIDMIDNDQEIDWFFDGILSLGGYGVIAGPPGVGKTQIALRLASSVALGRDFFHWENKTGKKGKVLFFSLEMNFVQIKYFLSQMTDLYEFKDELQENFILYPFGSPIALDTDRGQKAFTEWIEQEQPDLIIIDSLSKAVAKSLSEDEPVRKMNAYFNKLSHDYGTSIVAVHHSKKNQDKRKYIGDLDDLYGSRFIGSEADFVFSFVPYGNEEKVDQIRVIGTKVRLGPYVKPMMLERTANLNFIPTADVISTSEGDLSAAFYPDSQRGDSTGGSKAGPEF